MSDRAARRPPGRRCCASASSTALLVTNLVNVRWLTGFTGTNGACVVTRDERLFLTDFRYVEQAREQVPRLRAPASAAATCSATWPRGCAAAPGFDDAHLSVRAHRKLAEKAAGRRRAGAGRGASWSACAP